MSSQGIQTTIEGPFIAAPVPGDVMLTNLQSMFYALAVEGVSTIRRNFEQGAAQRDRISTTRDRVADHVEGRIVSVRGNMWKSAAVFGVSTIGYGRRDAIAIKAAASEVESRTHAVGAVHRSVYQMRALLAANLTFGLE